MTGSWHGQRSVTAATSAGRRNQCFLTEREALSYMTDRLRRTAVFER
jgi:hypothetical protein